MRQVRVRKQCKIIHWLHWSMLHDESWRDVVGCYAGVSIWSCGHFCTSLTIWKSALKWSIWGRNKKLTRVSPLFPAPPIKVLLHRKLIPLHIWFVPWAATGESRSHDFHCGFSLETGSRKIKEEPGTPSKHSTGQPWIVAPLGTDEVSGGSWERASGCRSGR